MEPEYELVTLEIPTKGKGYLIVRRCGVGEINTLVGRATGELLGQGATEVFAACSDLAVPLEAGLYGDYRLELCHELFYMGRMLDGDRPRPAGRLVLEPLCREKGGQFLTLLNESFFAVPNSATNGAKELEDFLSADWRCGFALLDGNPVGVYACELGDRIPEIDAIGLVDGARGKGLGRELLLAVMDLLAELGHLQCRLMVSTGNMQAYPLYQWAGFEQERLVSRWFEVLRV